MKTTTPGSGPRSVRFVLGVIAITILASLQYQSRIAVQAQSPPCDIVCENAKTAGVTPQSQWDIVGIGDENIQGFATDISVNRGAIVHFKISSTTTYNVEIYRLGYYGGNGARRVATITGLSGNVTQPACLSDSATGLVDCSNWVETASWQTDVNIPSGIFIAKLVRSGGGASHIPFIVRDDNYAADLLFQTSDTTWQAYNRWGGGSLYCDGPISNANTAYANVECPGRAVKVSYNRPFDTRGHDARSFLFNAEYPMLRWLEKNGYSVKYWTGVDTDRFGANAAIGLTSVKKPKIFLSVGHDEYWSGAQRTNVENARSSGVNLAFFSGNEAFWKTRWENSVDGTSHRTLVGYKESLTGTEIDGTPSAWTGTWRDMRFSPPADGGRPENALTGTLWTVNQGSAALNVPEAMGKLRLWRGISGVADLAPGATATLGVETVGYEWDEDVNNGFRPAGLMRLSSTTVGGTERVLDENGVVVGPGTATHSLTMYRHPSGARVFGAGTVQWSWGLDGNHDRGTPATHPPDVRMEQATVNLFADMGDVRPVLPTGSQLTLASPSNDSAAPDSFITSPASGSQHPTNAPIFIKGTASDAGGQVAGVEVSTDNGLTWHRATGTTSSMYRWVPNAPGSYTIKMRATDDSGNIEADGPALSVTVTSPSQSPGGPVLVVTSAARPFTSYYTEILRTEGFNLFGTADITTVSAAMLGSYDLVILGEMPISAAQATMFGDWVTQGGNLIAMRPDKQLYGLLGLTDAAATLSNAYLRMGSQSGVPTAGIVNQTIQFHGTADLATLSGASSVATLYSTAATATVFPAATLRSVGVAGGQAAAFLYDLARSVVLTRQGNPAWAGQNRDLLDPVRSNDMFFGNFFQDPQPDWVNLDKVDIPQADEQQRLFANTLLHVTQDRKPLPRFWYFPRDEKAVVVMTGDAHGHGTSTARLNELNNLSAPNCSLNDWDCLRGTAYIYPNTLSLFDGGPGGVASYIAQGHEIALHVNTGCLDYNAASLDQAFATQLEDLALQYPSMPPPRTNRTHCIVWSDYTSQAEVELQNGIRYDTTYYYWPGTWVQNRPGFMGGSGMPMRFAKSTGELIDVYQDVTEMIDENNSSHTFPLFANALLDKAIGPEGYYGVFTANMHGDGGDSSDVKQAQIVAAAQSRSVPVVSAGQMLEWLDGRNNSAFGSLTWNNGTLSFTVTRAPGANGLRAMLPAFSGGSLDQIKRNGVPIAFTLTTIKGVTYAFFDATTASYEAIYLPDNTASVISNVSATALTASTALVAWITNEAATTRVDYGTTAAVLNQVATDNTLMVNHALTLTNLRANTTYYYRVASVDFFGNASAFPVAGDPPLSFTTPPLLQSFLDTTVADFSAGTPGTATLVAQTDDGEVILKPTDGSEFFGTSPPSGWTTGTYEGSGYVTFANGTVTLNNGWMRAATSYGPGRSLEFKANFGADTFQHTGFGQTFDCGQPWAIFSTAGETNQLWARTTSAGCPSGGGPFQDTPIPGNFNGSMHRYRIDWNTTDVAYFIDDVEVARHAIQITPMMQILAASDFDPATNPGELVLDWERMSAYPTPGEFLSRVFDAGSTVSWYNVVWTAALPAGTDVVMAARAGNTPTPDASWTAFTPVAGAAGRLTGVPAGQYLQYRATLSTNNTYVSPALRSVTVSHRVDVADTAPTAEDDAVTINENTPHTFPASGPGSLTANDVDAETPNQLTVIAVGNASNGTVILNLDGSVTFTPSPNFSGVGAFTYTVSDGGLTDDGIVTVTVNAVNDPPVGVPDPSPAPGSFYQATEDVALLVPVATGVLANDTDVDNVRVTLTAQVHSQPAHGTVTLNPDGSFVYRPAANYSGPDGFFYKVSDGLALSAPTGVSILVQGVNDAPVANNDSFTLSRSGVPITVSSLVRVGSTVNATTALAHGFAAGHPVRIEGATEAEYNGSFNVTATGPTTFSYTVAGTPVSPATGSIRATAENTTRTYAVPGVIGNDIDVEAQVLTATLGVGTQNGTLVFNGNGSFTYTPNANFLGVDSFTYSVSDGFGGISAIATATIAVHTEIAAVTVGGGGGTVSTGPIATIVDPLETSVTTPIAGEVTIEQAPISPANPAAGYTFLGQQVNIKISTITDANPLTDPNAPLLITFIADRSLAAPGQTAQTLQVFRNGVLLQNCPAGPLTTANYPCVSERTTLADEDLQFTVKSLAPSQWNVGAYIALDASMSTLEDTTLNGNVSSLSGHPNPGSLTFGTAIEPLHGTLTLNANGAFAYVPVAGYHGQDSFNFSVSDGNGGLGFATVFITIGPVNDAPVALPQPVITNEDTAKAITLTGSDADSDPLTFSIVLPPQHGGLTGAPPNVSYTPAANYNGPDSFTFTTRDGTQTSAAATVTITVNPINDAPAASNQNVTTNEDVAKGVTLSASDVDGGPLTYTIVTPPAHGSLSGTAPNLTYTPTANYAGADSFTFKATDNGSLDSNVATVNVTLTAVNDAPTASNQNVTTNEDVAKAVTLSANDVDGGPLTYTIVTPPAHGSLSGTAPNLTYTPTANYAGADSFTFKATDNGSLDSNVATVNVTLTAVNDAPTASNQNVTTNEDVAKAVTLSANDVDGGPLTYTIVTPPAHGSLSGTAPNLTYTPTANYAGADSFTFKATDNGTPALESAVATVNVTITAVNDAPTASNQNVTTNEDVAKGVTLSASDVDGGSLTYAIVTPPAHGSLSGTAPNLTYTPTANYAGADSFTFKATDNGSLDSNVATVNVTLTAVNDAPTIADIANQSTGGAAVGPVSFAVNDIDSSLASLTLTGLSSNTALVPNANIAFGGGAGNRTVTVTPVSGQTGSATITVTVSDGSLSAPDTFVVTVIGASTPTTTSTPTTSLNPATYGQAITFTATVTPGATGMVTFYDNGTALGTAPLSGGTPNIATFTSSTATALVQAGSPTGTPRSITAAYSGNSQFTGSTSGALSQTVNKDAATAVLTVTLMSVQYSDNQTYEVTVSGAAGAAPAQGVIFKTGTQQMNATPQPFVSMGGGVYKATYTGQLLEEPPSPAGQLRPTGTNKIVSATYAGLSTNYTLPVPTNKSMLVTKEDAALDLTVLSTGDVTAASNGTATIPLTVKVQDADATLGNLGLAQVIFINRSTGAMLATVNAAADGTATYNWPVTITGNSQSFQVGFMVTNYYNRNLTSDNRTIEVCKPGFCTP